MSNPACQLDQTTMNSDLPQYTAALRRERQSEAFGRWVNQEVSSQLRSCRPFVSRPRAAPPDKFNLDPDPLSLAMMIKSKLGIKKF